LKPALPEFISPLESRCYLNISVDLNCSQRPASRAFSYRDLITNSVTQTITFSMILPVDWHFDAIVRIQADDLGGAPMRRLGAHSGYHWPA